MKRVYILLFAASNVFGKINCPQGTEFVRDRLDADWSRESCKIKTPEAKGLIVPEAYYYSTGGKMFEGNKQRGINIGIWKHWSATGKPMKEVDYKEGSPVCDFKRKITTDERVVGYTKGTLFFPLLVVNGKNYYEFHATEVAGTARLRDALSGKVIDATFKTPERDAHTDNCVYIAELTTKLPDFSILVLGEGFQPSLPTKTEESVFYEMRKECVNQGDHPEGKEPPCTKPKILMVSDLDGNGKKEFWFTEPYKWDTGVSVAEFDPASKKLNLLNQDCSHCSD